MSMMLAMNEMQLRIKKRSQESCQEHLLRCTGSKEDKGVSDMKMGTFVIFSKMLVRERKLEKQLKEYVKWEGPLLLLF